ncbi:transposase [Endozoicomonas montiporae]|uniref:Transposase n=2 Tax=Endozoicomonas montiporae TaxID=1027273 RepID=A0A081NCA2_9GAMM|nr:transposase [Endozoicomonas montiporae]
MLKHYGQFSLKRMASVLGVSRSGFHRWVKNRHKLSQRAEVQAARDLLICEVFQQCKGRSGARRIQKDLADDGYPCCLKTIQASMKRQGLIPKAARKFKVTTDSKHSLPVAPNLLERDFTATKPNQKWAGDITYLQTTEGWLYLAVVIDLFSRKVIGWSMSTTMKASLICDALNMALWRRKFPTGVIFHSDRGSQYCSEEFRNILLENRLVQSMSLKGDCWNNACVESFFHSLKVEAILYDPMMNREQMRQTVFEYIEVDYNRTRRHSSLGYLSPEKYELAKVA